MEYSNNAILEDLAEPGRSRRLYSLFIVALFFSTFPIAIRNIFLFLLFFCYIGSKIYRKDLTLPESRLNHYILLLFLFSLLSLFKAEDHYQALDALLSPIFRYIAFYFIALELIRLKEVEKYIYILFASSLTMVFYGLYLDYFTRDNFFHRANSRGTFAGLFVFLSITLLITQKRSISKRGLFFLGALAGLRALTFYSRGAILGFLAGLALWVPLIIYKEYRGIHWKRVLLFSLLLLLLLTPIFTSDYLRGRFGVLVDYRDDGSTTTRLRMWRLSLDLIKENPFLGIGVGNFFPTVHEYGIETTGESPWSSRHQHPHNLYIQIALEQGLPSLLLFLLLLVITYRMAFTNYTSYALGEWGYVVGLLFLVMATALLTHSMVDFAVKRSFNGIMVILLAILNYRYYQALPLKEDDG